MIKVLNLYAGIGGNRRLWVGDIRVTAVEINPEIAKIYSDFFPNDIVIVGDAHHYLLEHYKEFDFIWTSPPCPTHSRVRKMLATKKDKSGMEFEQNKPVFPDMTLYSEIIFLDNYFNGFFVVENVIPFYEPLIKPQNIGRHNFWCNFNISEYQSIGGSHMTTISHMQKHKGFDISKYSISHRKDTILRNCVDSKLGLHIFDCAFKTNQKKLTKVT